MRTGNFQYTLVLAFVLQGILLGGNSVGAVPLDSESASSVSESSGLGLGNIGGYRVGYYGYGEGRGNGDGGNQDRANLAAAASGGIEGIRSLIRGFGHHALSRTWFGLGTNPDSDSSGDEGEESAPPPSPFLEYKHKHSLEDNLNHHNHKHTHTHTHTHGLDRSQSAHSSLDHSQDQDGILRSSPLSLTALDGIIGLMGKMVIEAGERMREAGAGLRIPMPLRLVFSSSSPSEGEGADGNAVYGDVDSVEAASSLGSGSGYESTNGHDYDSEQIVILPRRSLSKDNAETEPSSPNSDTRAGHESVTTPTPRRKFARRRRAHP